jgi:hypothetical protein
MLNTSRNLLLILALFSALLLAFTPVFLNSKAEGRTLSLHAPLDGELIVTGTLGEYRPNHFHRGLDFSTGGKTGKAVYSVEKGYVTKISYFRYGIGLAVWIRHPGKRESLYGHLSSLSPAILDHQALPQEIKDKLIRKEEFSHTFDDNTVKTAKGTLIAFSGESGIGLPHLHLELKEGNRYINPLLYNLPVTDTTPPIITEIQIIPLKPKSRINGKTEPLTLKLVQATPQSVQESTGFRMDYNIDPESLKQLKDGKIKVSGPVGFTVTGWDPFSESKLGYVKGVLYRNKEPVYSFDLDVLDQSEGDTETFRNILLYDAIRSKISNGTVYVHYFFERLKGGLSFIKSKNHGEIEADPEPQQTEIRIQVSDSYRNYSQVSLSLNPDTENYQDSSGFIALTGTDSDDELLESDDKLFTTSIPAESNLGSRSYSIKTLKAPVALPKGITAKSRIYSIGPVTRDLLNWYNSSFKGRFPEKTGVYAINPQNPFLFWYIPSEIKENEVQFRQQLTGSFIILKDEVAPVWKLTELKKTEENTYRLLLHAADTGSGIDPQSIDITINGKKVYTDHDSDRNHIEVVFPADVLTKGDYLLKAVIRDKAGNTSLPLIYKYKIP